VGVVIRPYLSASVGCTQEPSDPAKLSIKEQVEHLHGIGFTEFKVHGDEVSTLKAEDKSGSRTSI